MKNLKTIIISTLALIALVGCAKESSSTSMTNTENITYGDQLTLPTRDDYGEYDFPDASAETHFNNVDQYANMQGYMGWYYCYGSTDENSIEYMTYEGFSGKYKSPSALEAYVQKDEWQPSNEHEIMCGFKCPKDGTIDVKVDCTLIYEQGDGDDGISVYCLRSTNASEAFGSAYIIGQDPVKQITGTLEVKTNEVIYTVMSCNSSRWNDLSRIIIDIQYK